MMNVKGGFTYVDMSVYGTFTSGTAKTGQNVSGIVEKLTQYDKPVIVYGLTVSVTSKATVTTKYQPMLVSFSHTVDGTTGVITAAGTALAGAATLSFTITSAGSITVTAS